MASAEYHREWRRRNPDKVRAKRATYRSKPENRQKERAAAHRRRMRSPVRFMTDLFKASPCTGCGGRFPALVMEFDHRNADEKVADVAALVHQRRAPSVVFTEIAKCDLVCVNCHRLRTLDRTLDRQLPQG